MANFNYSQIINLAIFSPLWYSLLFSRQQNLTQLLFSLTHGTVILTQKSARSCCKQMYELTFHDYECTVSPFSLCPNSQTRTARMTTRQHLSSQSREVTTCFVLDDCDDDTVKYPSRWNTAYDDYRPRSGGDEHKSDRNTRFKNDTC